MLRKAHLIFLRRGQIPRGSSQQNSHLKRTHIGLRTFPQVGRKSNIPSNLRCVQVVHKYQSLLDASIWLSRVSCFLSGLVLYATVGTVALLTLLMLAITVRKCRIKLKPQPKVCSNSPVSAEEGEVWFSSQHSNCLGCLDCLVCLCWIKWNWPGFKRSMHKEGFAKRASVHLSLWDAVKPETNWLSHL